MKYALIGLVALALSGCGCNTPAEGEKIGQVAKIATSGFSCKTTEILVTGKFGGGETWMTVPPQFVAAAKAANESQAFVKITYHTDLVNSICSNDTQNRWLDSIENHPQGQP